MRLFKILDGVDCQPVHGDDVEISGITIDSRTVADGSLFFCIGGLTVDGHEFIGSAVSKGAAAIVIEKDLPKTALPKEITVIKTSNSRVALARAAANFFNNPAENFNLYGVTGTNGKTSTTYFLESIFQRQGKKTGLLGTIQIRINKQDTGVHFAAGTTPDTIELQQVFAKMSAAGAEEVVMEVSSHGLALNKVDFLKFKAGIFTNLTQDHLDFHGTMEEYKKAKARLFENCQYAVINADDDAAGYFLKRAEEFGCKIISYGIEKPCDLKASDTMLRKDGVQFNVTINGELIEFFVPISGKFTIYNALGAIGAALCAGVPVEVIKEALREMQGVPGRIQSVSNKLGINVIVDYSHTPDSLLNIIAAVREFTDGRIITVFGCGGDRDRTKRPLMGDIAGRHSDYCIITSDNPRTENPERIIDDIEPAVIKTGNGYERVTDRREAIFRAISVSKPGDSVIIAGKGHENYQIFADRTIHFDDCEVAAEAIEKTNNP